MKTYLLTYEAQPHATNQCFGKVARVLCAFWITSQDQEDAQLRAVEYGHEMGWNFSNWIRIAIARRQDHSHDPRQLERFDCAQRDGAACMINVLS